MKNKLSITILCLIATLSVSNLRAQDYEKKWRNYRPCPIDWTASQTDGKRYTVALRPGYLINNGLKADFEFELEQGGNWIQCEIIGRYTGWSDGSEYSDSGIIETGSYSFSKMDGFGLGVAYKHFFRPNGWYFSTGAVFNYYNVHHSGIEYYKFTEEGSVYYTYRNGTVRTRYYKPALNFNIGKHMALSRNFFLDAYVGIGYTRSFFGDTNPFPTHTPFSIAYSGLNVSGGFRIGYMFTVKP